MLKVYVYPKCSTCKKALAFLRDNGLAHEAVDISKEGPPAAALLEMIRRRGSVRAVFNSSGQSYRNGGFSERLSGMSEQEALQALAADGMLVKRPFLLSDSAALVGFKPEEWKVLVK